MEVVGSFWDGASRRDGLRRPLVQADGRCLGLAVLGDGRPLVWQHHLTEPGHEPRPTPWRLGAVKGRIPPQPPWLRLEYTKRLFQRT